MQKSEICGCKLGGDFAFIPEGKIGYYESIISKCGVGLADIKNVNLDSVWIVGFDYVVSLFISFFASIEN